MNQHNIFRKIGSILTELNEQYQFLAQNPEQLNELEVELFLANSNFLTDHVQIIKKLNSLTPEVEEENIKINEVLSTQENIAFDNKPIVNEVEEAPEEFQLQEIVQTENAEEYTSLNEEPIVNELEDIVEAEEAEERVDIVPEQEIIDEDIIHKKIAESDIEHDFFKLDSDVNTFEFELGNKIKLENEETPVEQTLDRQLTNADDDILTRRKSILENKIIPEAEDSLINEEEDEIGPEPFLILNDQEPEVSENKIIASQPTAKASFPKYDEPIISPSVVIESPVFIPNAMPVKPTVQPESEQKAPSLNDLLAKTNGHSDSFKAPIADLKQAINLNEKLLFIKDLFNGYNMAYSEAIDLVNKMANFEVADNFLQQNYAIKNNWASKQATVDQFYELLNRRFGR